MENGGNKVFFICAFTHPCPSGLLHATGPTLSMADQVDNSADSFSEHDAYQVGIPQANELYHGPTWSY